MLDYTAAIAGRDMEVDACQRFFKDGLTLSFNRILTDDAVTTWKPDIQVHTYNIHNAYINNIVKSNIAHVRQLRTWK